MIVVLLGVSTVSAATGSTAPVIGAGGPARAYNFTTKQMDMVPQCFPWTWLSNFQRGSIFDIYTNQKACQVQRSIDFGM